MPKTITSPVERFPGTVTLKDPIPLIDIAPLERAMVNANKLKDTGDFTRSELQALLLPGLLRCIVRFDLAGIPEYPGIEDIPGGGTKTGRKDSALLIDWLIDEIMEVYAGETVPLAS